MTPAAKALATPRLTNVFNALRRWPAAIATDDALAALLALPRSRAS